MTEPPDDQVTLPGLSAAGLPFPYWEDHFDWDAAGARTDHVAGRSEGAILFPDDPLLSPRHANLLRASAGLWAR